MSDHPAPAAPAKGASGGSVGEKAWSAVGVTISVMLAGILILWIVGSLLLPGASGLQQVTSGLGAVNQALLGVKLATNSFIINMIQMVALPVILYLLIKHWALK